MLEVWSEIVEMWLQCFLAVGDFVGEELHGRTKTCTVLTIAWIINASYH